MPYTATSSIFSNGVANLAAEFALAMAAGTWMTGTDASAGKY